ncbi:cytochrome p450 protein [Rutstroemia sp. NJR-2017a BBW]|nr:cytochrome p450 protein [Rutstroemia sp. NJR-2017a BBW]
MDDETGHITQDTPLVFRATSDYWGENETLADELWESINIDPITVALSSEYVEQHGLADSARFPWDNDKRTYILKGFHDLHCLKSMRRAFVDLQRGVDTKTDWFHMYHCLDALRQDLMCYADDTPMPIPKDITYIGDGQVRQCRDWNKLTAWATAPEQNACYRQLSDYNQVFHSLEKFAYCPEGSPYYDIQREYFEKHGHRDPFVE